MHNIKQKIIINYPGYEAGSDGHIYSYKGLRERQLKEHPQGNGKYLIVVLRKNNKSFTKNVHRLICESFNGIPNKKFDVSHINGNCKDNRPENLIWENRSNNCHRKKLHGTDDIGTKIVELYLI